MNETEDEMDIVHAINLYVIIHMINRDSHAFLCNFGDTLHSDRAKITLATYTRAITFTLSSCNHLQIAPE